MQNPVTAIPSQPPHNHHNTTLNSRQAQALSRSLSLTNIGNQFLPANIWDETWTPPPVSNRVQGLLSVDDVSQHVYNIIPGELRLTLRGKNVEDLAVRFRAVLAAAASSKDFSLALATERDFIMYVLFVFLQNSNFSNQKFNVLLVKIAMALFNLLVLELKVRSFM